jgi:photosystem II stability/assembly factor-like uncharacterized protein
LDPGSPQGRPVLYATVFEGGVYKSTNGGQSWTHKSKGLGHPKNMHCLRVRIHPRSNNLYCLVTGFRRGSAFDVPGGLWRSTDGGESWSDLTATLKPPWPTGFAVHPTDEKVLYLSTASAPQKEQGGGVFKSSDGGATWQHVIQNAEFAQWTDPPYVHGMMVTLHPDDPNLVYFGAEGHGLWYSTNAGATWQVYREFPFRNVNNVSFDPTDHTVMYVSTFGAGVWKGPHLPTLR